MNCITRPHVFILFPCADKHPGVNAFLRQRVAFVYVVFKCSHTLTKSSVSHNENAVIFLKFSYAIATGDFLQSLLSALTMQACILYHILNWPHIKQLFRKLSVHGWHHRCWFRLWAYEEFSIHTKSFSFTKSTGTGKAASNDKLRSGAPNLQPENLYIANARVAAPALATEWFNLVASTTVLFKWFNCILTLFLAVYICWKN